MIGSGHTLCATAPNFRGAGSAATNCSSRARPFLYPSGALEALSYYDVPPLKATLERLVDFDLINACVMRFRIGVVYVGTGTFVYFDSITHQIPPEHVMADGSLPPGFPATETEGEHYWDAGLVSNTLLQWMLDSRPGQATLAF